MECHRYSYTPYGWQGLKNTHLEAALQDGETGGSSLTGMSLFEQNQTNCSSLKHILQHVLM